MKRIVIDFIVSAAAIAILLITVYAVSRNPIWGWQKSIEAEAQQESVDKNSEKPLIEDIAIGIFGNLGK